MPSDVRSYIDGDAACQIEISKKAHGLQLPCSAHVQAVAYAAVAHIDWYA